LLWARGSLRGILVTLGRRRQTVKKGFDQRRLANPRFASDEDELPFTVQGFS
jgi:hypothetical protein